MRSFSEIEIFSRRALDLLEIATRCVAAIPDNLHLDDEVRYEGVVPESLHEIRCHEVARAVGQVLGLDVQDGRYGVVEHSWLWVDPAPRTCLLDVYCVGRLPMVQLVDIDCVLPHWQEHWRLKRGWRHLGYVCGELRTDIREATVRRLVRSMPRSTSGTR